MQHHIFTFLAHKVQYRTVILSPSQQTRIMENFWVEQKFIFLVIDLSLPPFKILRNERMKIPFSFLWKFLDVSRHRYT